MILIGNKNSCEQYENKHYAGNYNVGPVGTPPMTTENLVLNMNKYIDFNWDETGVNIGKENECSALDVTKITSKLNWYPVFFENDLVCKATADWYNNYILGHNMQEYTLAQIKEAYNEYED